MPNQIRVWIYNDEGASQLSVQSALATFKSKLPAHLITSVRSISSADILAGVLDDPNAQGVLVMPGGADLPYCQKLNGLGNDKIREFVHRGNIYIGICAGGYYGAREIAFSGDGYEICGARELAFFSGTAIGSLASLTQGQLYDETVRSKAIATLDFMQGHQDDLYYHGGAYFVSDERDEREVSDSVSRMTSADSFETVASYPDGVSAVIEGDIGRGKYLLAGVHFELCPKVYNELVMSQAHSCNEEKEASLLALITQKHYGALIFECIKNMLIQVFPR